MEAEDILQEAFVKVFENIKQYRFKGSFEGWMRKIVVNTALKKLERKSRQNEEPLGEADYLHPSAPPLVYQQFNEADLLNIVASLPEGYRIVFNLYAIEGYSHDEIAEMLGIQASTSRSQLAKARKMLQALLLDSQKTTA